MIGRGRGWVLPLLAVAGVAGVLGTAHMALTGEARPTRSAESAVTDVPRPPAARSASPTRWCPSQGEAPPASCIGYDGESAMALNHRYSQRESLPTERVQALRADRQEVEGIIRQALHSTPVMNPQQLRDVLAAHGYQVSFSIRDTSELTADTTFDFAVEKGGCIHGVLAPGRVTMGSVDGYIADGGCIPAVGH